MIGIIYHWTEQDIAKFYHSLHGITLPNITRKATPTSATMMDNAKVPLSAPVRWPHNAPDIGTKDRLPPPLGRKEVISIAATSSYPQRVEPQLMIMYILP